MGEGMKCQAGRVNNETSWDLDKLYDCMMASDAATLRDHEWAVTGEFADFPWTPMVDGDFFVEHPLSTLKRGDFINTGEHLDYSHQLGNKHSCLPFYDHNMCTTHCRVAGWF